MDSPGSRPGGRARVAPLADGLVLYSRARSSWRSVHSSESNELPASQSSGMPGKGANPQEQVPCPKCGKKVQRRYLRKHERSQHQGVRRRRHACPYCITSLEDLQILTKKDLRDLNLPLGYRNRLRHALKTLHKHHRKKLFRKIACLKESA